MPVITALVTTLAKCDILFKVTQVIHVLNHIALYAASIVKPELKDMLMDRQAHKQILRDDTAWA